MMVAVKTKRQLRSKSNVSLTCLATKFFAVGLIFSTYGYQSKKLVTPRRAKKTNLKQRAHEESEVESYLSKMYFKSMLF